MSRIIKPSSPASRSLWGSWLEGPSKIAATDSSRSRANAKSCLGFLGAVDVRDVASGSDCLSCSILAMRLRFVALPFG